jgi:hypothetical protein
VISFIVIRRGSKYIKETNGSADEVPTRCTHVETGEVRTSSLASAYFLKNVPIVHKRFHISKTSAMFWHGPGGFDSGGEFEVSGRLKRKGHRGEGKFIASGIVNGKWDCTTGRLRWRSRGV